MSKNRIIFTLLFIMFYGSLGSQIFTSPGVVDLRGHDWSLPESTLALDGLWLFNDTPVPVPGNLNFQGSPYGHGTYRLSLILDHQAPDLALRIPSIGMASRIMVNGVIVSEIGIPGTNQVSESPASRPQIIMLPQPRGNVTLLQVDLSNYHDMYAGINYSVHLGTVAAITRERELGLIGESLFFGGLLLLSLYHFGSFFFRTKNLAPLWLSMLGFTVGLRATLYSEVLMATILPGLPWLVMIKTLYLCMTLGSLAFLHYIKHLYPRFYWHPIYLMSWILLALYGLINVFAPIQWSTTLLPFFQALMLTTGVYGIVILVRALKARLVGAGIFLGGLLAFMATLIFDIIKVYALFSFPSVVNQGLLVFMLAQALVVARIFSNNLELVEAYSSDLGKLNSALSRFIPREVLGFLNKKDITEISLGDYTELEMTVFFLDIRDFTTLSEGMSPKDNFRFINSFLLEFGPLVRKYGGFVDKYLGDGIMALFPGNPWQAIQAAQAMRQVLADFNMDRARRQEPPVHFGIGIHTGMLMLGTIGENNRMDSTVISDSVNIASRLEGLTKKFNCDVLVSRSLIDALDADKKASFTFVSEELVKGKSKAIEVYSINTTGLT